MPCRCLPSARQGWHAPLRIPRQRLAATAYLNCASNFLPGADCAMKLKALNQETSC